MTDDRCPWCGTLRYLGTCWGENCPPWRDLRSDFEEWQHEQRDPDEGRDDR